MHSPNELLQLCRLCLVKDQVNIPIFDRDDDIRQIFHKISTCLPVKVSQDDNLPKKVCDDCSLKLDAFYKFWNTSSNSERQLLQWLNDAASTNGLSVPPSHSINTDEVVLKQEIVDIDDNPADEIATDDLHVPTDSEYLQSFADGDYEFPQEDTFNEGEDPASTSVVGPSATITSSSAVKAAPQRKRKVAAVRSLPPQTNSDEEDDVEEVETKIAKTEKQSDDEGDNTETTTFLGLPIDNEQPGPSGVDKAASDTPDEEDQETVKRCSKCQNIFTSLQAYRIHRKMYKHHCPLCSTEFMRHSQLNNHLTEFHAENLHKCRFCSKIFTSKSLLIHHTFAHMLSHVQGKTEANTNPTTEKHVCDICSLSFRFRNQLILHKQSHFTEAPTRRRTNVNRCGFCLKTYRHKYFLEAHERLHENLKHVRHQLNAEGKIDNPKFFQSQIIKQEKRYPCEYCSSSFKFKSQLGQHMQSHLKKRKNAYRCGVCLKRYHNKHFLNLHEKLHQDRFKCEYCDQAFHTIIDMETHKQMVHAALIIASLTQTT